MMMNEMQLIEKINALPAGNHVIAIDGRCAAGKSTLARKLSALTGAGIIHMDDFYLPMEMRTVDRLAEPGGNVYYERFLEEVIPFLKQNRPFSYRRFECSIMDLGEVCQVPTSRFTIVEGAYSCHPKLGDYMSLRVFADVEQEMQLERIRSRNGEQKLQQFIEKWIPMEEAYFAAYQIQEKSDIILK
ncbi:MAG: uridine kinase [Lachnospiraceae bacterium]|nr:uridine kinase [Lachnospiraceae bacterium]